MGTISVHSAAHTNVDTSNNATSCNPISQGPAAHLPAQKQKHLQTRAQTSSLSTENGEASSNGSCQDTHSATDARSPGFPDQEAPLITRQGPGNVRGLQRLSFLPNQLRHLHLGFKFWQAEASKSSSRLFPCFEELRWFFLKKNQTKILSLSSEPFLHQFYIF